MSKDIDIIRVYSDKGASTTGCQLGADSIYNVLDKEKIISLGFNISKESEISTHIEDKESELKNLKSVNDINLKLFNCVSDCLKRNSLPIVLGGDHSLAVGSVFSVQAHYKNIGLIWVDAHGDFNNKETSPSKNIHGMPMSALTGNGPNEIIPFNPPAFINEKNTVLIAARDLDEAEKQRLRQSQISVFTMQDIDREGIDEIINKAIKIASLNTEGIYLSFDLDAIDPIYAMGVGTPVLGGLTVREARQICESLSGKLLGFEIVELNPTLDKFNTTAQLSNLLILSLLKNKLL